MLISESIQKVSFSYEPNIYVRTNVEEKAIEPISQIQFKNTENFFQRKENSNQENNLFPLEKYNFYMQGSFLDVYA